MLFKEMGCDGSAQEGHPLPNVFTYCVCSTWLRPLCLLTPQAALLGNEDKHSRGEELPNYSAIPAPGMQFEAILYPLAKKTKEKKKLLRSLSGHFNVLF